MKRAMFVGVALMLLVVNAAPASAHTADTTIFGRVYRSRTILNMYYASGPNTWWQTIPGLTEPVTKGMESWNYLQPNDNIHFNAAGFLGGMIESDPCAQDVNVNGIFWTNVQAYTSNQNAIGHTSVCYAYYPNDFRRIKSAVILFDGDRAGWSLDTNPNSAGTPNTNDLWGVATHELGHALGMFMGTTPGTNGVRAEHWESPIVGSEQGLDQTAGYNDPNHPDGKNLCPGTTARHSMCSVQIMGTTSQRSPAPHDQHTVYNRYGPGYP